MDAMTAGPRPTARRSWALGLLILLAAWLALAGPMCGRARAAGRGQHPTGTVELDTRSEFSHILVRRRGSIVTMTFIRDNGVEVEESMVNTARPYELLLPYARYMFASYLFVPQPRRVLIVGLGGGAMVHFLSHFDPQVTIDVVEIDPVVVTIAQKYFGLNPSPTVNITTGDGLKYLAETTQRYDVIYMDAFLKPAADTDVTGLPLRLKTEEFYKKVQEKLTPGGLVAFNLNQHSGTASDIALIQSAFRQAYVFRPPMANVVVLASPAPAREPLPALVARAKEADRRLTPGFSFHELLNRLAP